MAIKKTELLFDSNDRIAIIAPHPDDECLGVSSALLRAPAQTDVYVLTDGGHGNQEKSIEEEAAIRTEQALARFQNLCLEIGGSLYAKVKETDGLVSRICFTGKPPCFEQWLEGVLAQTHPVQEEEAGK